MLSFLKNLFVSEKKRYENQRQLLAKGSLEGRKALAKSTDTHPEILYYLAKDSDAEVRGAVARNRSTPVQASTLLANDKMPDVRMALAARLVDLLPGLSEEKQSQLYSYAVQALGVLAQDEVLKIRRALSAALKDCAQTPPAVAGQLARDVEREVSEPILRFCVALSDDDLLDILSHHPEPWVLSAIAGRPVVREPVSGGIVDSEDVPATTVLIKNAGASMAEATLQKIIDRAKDYPEWHEPIAARKELTVDLAHQLMGFVNKAVLDILEKRTDFDAATRKEVARLVQRRLEYHRHSAPGETPEAKVERYIKTGKLGEEVIHDALVWQEFRFVALALAWFSKIHPIVVDKMLKSGSAKPVVALCWKGKLSMRLCLALQKDYARLQPKEFIYGRGGTDYPLTPEDIRWQLEFFGVEK